MLIRMISNAAELAGIKQRRLDRPCADKARAGRVIRSLASPVRIKTFCSGTGRCGCKFYGVLWQPPAPSRTRVKQHGAARDGAGQSARHVSRPVSMVRSQKTPCRAVPCRAVPGRAVLCRAVVVTYHSGSSTDRPEMQPAWESHGPESGGTHKPWHDAG